MDDLISRKVLENVILRKTAWFDNADEDVAYEAIQKVPAVDAVEVVRCGECACWNFETGDCHSVVGLPSPVEADDYCSFGVRKEAPDV